MHGPRFSKLRSGGQPESCCLIANLAGALEAADRVIAGSSLKISLQQEVHLNDTNVVQRLKRVH